MSSWFEHGFQLAAIPPWAKLICFFTLWIIVWAVIKGFLFRRLAAWAQKTRAQWDDKLVHVVQMPLWLLVIGAGAKVGSDLIVLSSSLTSLLQKSSLVFYALALIVGINRFLLLFFHSYIDKNASLKPSRSIIRTVIYAGVWSIGILIILDSLGVTITPLLASLGVGSLAIGLAAQDTLGNLFSGIYIMIDRPVREGDFVRLESGEEGYVQNIGWRSTRIKDILDNVLIIPNSTLASSQFVNYYLPKKELGIRVDVGVSYKEDLEKVEQVTLEVARDLLQEVEGGVAAHEPRVRFQTFGSSSIDFFVVLRVKEFRDKFLVQHEFIKRLHQRYNQEGIEIPFPQRTLHLETVPESFNNPK